MEWREGRTLSDSKVLHETIELLQQRIFGLCGGYADCNDAARLVHDPIHKLVLDRNPLTGLGLASQLTLSRFENGVSARELRAMTHVLADTVIAQQQRRLKGRAPRIIIDLDPTDHDPPIPVITMPIFLITIDRSA